jgi:4-amino-4-deoxy-L-arabinose transferase-like glycosyltransferase
MSEQAQPTIKRARHWRLVSAVTLITVAGAVLRFWGLGAKSLWLDEIITADVIRQGLKNIIAHCLGDTGPLPFSYLFIWLAEMARRSEFLLRLPDCVFGIATIPLIFFLGRKLAGRTDVGIIAALLLALSSYHHYYSQEARGYGVLVMLFCASLYVLLVALQTNRALLWIAFIALSFMMTFTSYFGAIAFGALIVYGALRIFTQERAKPALRRRLFWLSLSVVVCGTPFLLWAAQAYSVFQEYGASHRLPPHTIPALLSYFISSLREFAGGSTGASAVLYGFVVLGWVGMREARPARVPHLTALLALLPLGAMYAAGVGHFLNPRFLMTLLPLVMIGAAMGISYSWEAVTKRSPSGWRVVLHCCVVLLVAFYLGMNVRETARNLATEKQDWRTAARFVEQHFRVGDFIVGGRNAGSLCIAYYIHPDLRKAILYDYYSTELLRQLLSLDRRVWYVTAYYRTDANRPPLDKWLDRTFEHVRVIPGSMDSIHIFLSKQNVQQE